MMWGCSGCVFGGGGYIVYLGMDMKMVIDFFNFLEVN